MKQLIFISLLMIGLTSNAYSAGEQHMNHNTGHHHTHDGLSIEKQTASAEGAACENIIDISVNGLVCDFCARAVEKVFGEQEGVTGVDVDLNAGKVVVATEAGVEIDDETVTTLIQDSGYNLVGIARGCS